MSGPAPVGDGPGPVHGHRPWRERWRTALYGPEGFYLDGKGPAGHFRTACHAAADLLAPAVVRLAARYGATTVVDVGAGRGEFAAALAAHPDAAGLAVHAVDLVPRPVHLPAAVGWARGLDDLDPAVLRGALVTCWELLDVVPADVLEVGADGTLHEVWVDATGHERPGPAATPEAEAWCRRHWHPGPAGTRLEVGLTRDAVWADLVRRVARAGGGTLLAVDYALRGGPARRAAEHPDGTLVGYRRGTAVPPVPDGTCDLTSHVDLVSAAAAGVAAGARPATPTTQGAALRAWGVTDPLAGTAPQGGVALLAHLSLRSRLAELLDPAGLGGFGWLEQQVPADPPLGAGEPTR